MINEIKHLFPAADPLVDFELRDNSDGNGPFIARWDSVKLGAKPTKEALAAVTVEALAAATARKDSDKAKAELASIDLASIRAIREYIVSKPDAPQILKDHEASAALARAKVKR